MAQLFTALPADMRNTTYVVMYRTGGWASCTWRLLLDRYTYDGAVAKALEIEAMGYKAIYRTVAEHDLLGMPIGWEHTLVDHREDTITVGVAHTMHTMHPSRIDAEMTRRHPELTPEPVMVHPQQLAQAAE